MKTFKIVLTGLVTLVAVSAASAQGLEIKKSARVYSADGVSLGRVDRVITGNDGAATGIQLIADGRFVTIGADTLSSSDKGIVTTLSRKDVRNLR